MNDKINPSHYRSHPSGVEAIEVCRHLDFRLGNAVKYVWRCVDKNGIEDLMKARWYLFDLCDRHPNVRPCEDARFEAAKSRVLKAHDDEEYRQQVLYNLLASVDPELTAVKRVERLQFSLTLLNEWIDQHSVPLLKGEVA